MLPKTDLVSPSPEGVAKLGTLDPILRYHQRQSIVEIRVLRSPTATAVFLAGAAILITEPALNILAAEELQAVVAHELAHEYFWSRFELALNNHKYAELQQLELRCDGIAVVTLLHVGVNPERLISAIKKLDQHNRRQGTPSSMNYVDFSERSTFIRLIADLVRGRSACGFLIQTSINEMSAANSGD
jgi:hypothetical protein